MAGEQPELHADYLFLRDPNVHFPSKPQLLPDLAIYQMPEGIGLQIRGGPRAVSIRGANASAVLDYLLPTLNGTRGLDELIDASPAGISKSAVIEALAVLHAKGLLCEPDRAHSFAPGDGSEILWERQLLFWGRNIGISGFPASGNEAADSLARTPILLVGTGLFGATCYDLLVRAGCARISVIDWDDDGLLFATLQSSGQAPIVQKHLDTNSVGQAATAVKSIVHLNSLVVTATRNAPASLFRSINRICLDADCPVLFGNDNGSEFEIGPYVVPWATSCFVCKEMRVASAHANMLEEHVYNLQLEDERSSGETRPKGESLAAATMLASWISLEVTRILTGIAPPLLLNAIQLITPLTGGMETHAVRRVPRCTACSRNSTLEMAGNAEPPPA